MIRWAGRLLVAVLWVLACVVPGRAQDDVESLKKAVEELRAEVARLGAQPGDARIAELERRLDLLAAELEVARTGGAASSSTATDDDDRPTGTRGLAPSASKVYRAGRGVSIGGYGEVLYENFGREREDGGASGRTDQIDFLRQIVYVGYKFDDRFLFNSEIEFEHASTGKGGEVSVEFGYLDFQPSPKVGLRAGMVLVPMGFLNELHEPPIFHGARRPDVESTIVPSTWRENGAGLFGEAGPLQWRAYVVSGLSSAGMTASGIRGARQSGARSRSEDLAFTGRADFTGVGGLLAGASFFSGGSGQGATVGGEEIGGRVTLYDLHAQYEWRGVQVRGLWARGTVDDAALINRQNNLAGPRSVGEDQWGWYVQGAFDVMSLRPAGRLSVSPFVRYERLDSQDGVPAGFTDDPATERSVLTVGLGVRPIPQVVVKGDWQRHRTEARTGVDQWNLAVGWLF